MGRKSPAPRKKPVATVAGAVQCQHGAIKAVALNPQEVNRFKWVVKDAKYLRPRCTPGGGPPFTIAEGERWLDLGANVGFFALLVLDHGAASVVCVEAEALNAERLRSNLVGRRGVSIVRALVRKSAAHGARLLLSRKTTRHSVLCVPEAKPSGDAQMVPKVTTLRALLAAQSPGGGGTPDAVKINIEGAELEVLLATTARDWRAVRKMVVEYSFDVLPTRADYDKLLAHLRSSGWEVHPEPVPAWFTADKPWDRRRTLGNDARQIWAFREPAAA
eukprot:NODE_16509_length_990_cov_10.307068.p1 GENE.NODE_16509_length_990_cov_10.307068~~NODE_16509_length_990_cov_10.307068.p1  ORF type:complete len:301 (+),score=89.88 NODE_16509_length_990_cov_10.307068:79-903(+)